MSVSGCVLVSMYMCPKMPKEASDALALEFQEVVSQPKMGARN